MTVQQGISTAWDQDSLASSVGASEQRERTPWLLAFLCLLIPALPASVVVAGPLKSNGSPAKMIAVMFFGAHRPRVHPDPANRANPNVASRHRFHLAVFSAEPRGLWSRPHARGQRTCRSGQDSRSHRTDCIHRPDALRPNTGRDHATARDIARLPGNWPDVCLRGWATAAGQYRFALLLQTPGLR